MWIWFFCAILIIHADNESRDLNELMNESLTKIYSRIYQIWAAAYLMKSNCSNVWFNFFFHCWFVFQLSLICHIVFFLPMPLSNISNIEPLIMNSSCTFGVLLRVGPINLLKKIWIQFPLNYHMLYFAHESNLSRGFFSSSALCIHIDCLI